MKPCAQKRLEKCTLAMNNTPCNNATTQRNFSEAHRELLQVSLATAAVVAATASLLFILMACCRLMEYAKLRKHFKRRTEWWINSHNQYACSLGMVNRFVESTVDQDNRQQVAVHTVLNWQNKVLCDTSSGRLSRCSSTQMSNFTAKSLSSATNPHDDTSLQASVSSSTLV